MGGSGQLVIGGVGLARYLDAEKDAEKYAPLESLGWERAYRSGDLVRGRRPRGWSSSAGPTSRSSSAAAGSSWARWTPRSRRCPAWRAPPRPYGPPAAATSCWSATWSPRTAGTRPRPSQRLRAELPAALVPLLAPVRRPADPHLRQGRPQRAALAAAGGGWRPAGARRAAATAPRPGWPSSGPRSSACRWPAPRDDFFAIGGGSLAAAQLTTLLRTRYPRRRRAGRLPGARPLRKLARLLDRSAQGDGRARDDRARADAGAKVVQLLAAAAPVHRWSGCAGRSALLALGNRAGPLRHYPWAPTASWWLVGRRRAAALQPARTARDRPRAGRGCCCAGVQPGSHPRGGGVHLRLWAAERLAEVSGATALSGAWLHPLRAGRSAPRSAPTSTCTRCRRSPGMLKLGRGCAVEAEVDLCGYWLDGDRLEIGTVKVGAGAVVGTRSTLLPGRPDRQAGRDRRRAPASPARCPTGQRWAGAPAAKVGKAERTLAQAAARRARASGRRCTAPAALGAHAASGAAAVPRRCRRRRSSCRTGDGLAARPCGVR